MALHHIIYQSHMVSPDESVVNEVLQTALWNNPRKGITGMMLYADGDILQVLEGERSEIESLFARIECDRRHNQIFVVLSERLAARHFPDWSMGYRRIGPAELQQFQHFQKVFQSTPAEVSARARQGVASEVINAFCAWAMA